MGLIILSKCSYKIPAETIDRAWQRNPCGAGVAYISGGKLVINKSFNKLVNFKAWYVGIDSMCDPGTQVVLSFNTLSVAKNTIENKSPIFTHENEVAIAIDGCTNVIEVAQDKDKTESAKIAEILSKLKSNWSTNASMQILVNDFTDGSRAISITKDDFVMLYGWNEWIKDETNGVYYSNNDFEKPKLNIIHGYTNTYGKSSKSGKCTLCKCDLGDAETIKLGKCWLCMDESEFSKICVKNQQDLFDKSEACSVCGSYLSTLKEKQDGICDICDCEFNKTSAKAGA